MNLFKLLLLALLKLISTSQLQADNIQCPQNFKLVGNKKCVQLFTRNAQYKNADATCKQYGGYLVSIANAVDNFGLMAMLPANGNSVWLGLNCTESKNTNTCLWDDGSGRVTYGNFMSGFPLVDIGQCVYMLNYGNLKGRWMSGGCTSVDINFFCEVSPVNTTDTTCLFKFGENCYSLNSSLVSEPEARSACQKDCGDLVSIHSSDENSFVQNLFPNTLPTHIRIGGLMSDDGALSWTDNSPFDYNNMGFDRPKLGDCMSMALKDDIIGQGKWISSQCEVKLPFVCKRASGNLCGATVVPSPTPNECSGVKFLENTGTFYSPNWPNSFIPESGNRCSFVITTPIGTIAQLKFPILELVPTSLIYIHNEVENMNPSFILNEYSKNATWYNSTTDVMKVTFQPCTLNCVQYTGLYRWQATFGPAGGIASTTVGPITTPAPFVTITPDPRNPSGCNSTVLTTPGVITSPNYPKIYSNSLTCFYRLSAPEGMKIHVDFADVSTEQCCDIIVAYDGKTEENAVIGKTSGHPEPHTVIFNSSSNFMLIKFTTDTSGQDTGFNAVFTAV